MSVGDPISVCERGRGQSCPRPAVQLSGRCGSYQCGHDPGDSGDGKSDGTYTTFSVYTHTVRLLGFTDTLYIKVPVFININKNKIYCIVM